MFCRTPSPSVSRTETYLYYISPGAVFREPRHTVTLHIVIIIAWLSTPETWMHYRIPKKTTATGVELVRTSASAPTLHSSFQLPIPLIHFLLYHATRRISPTHPRLPTNSPTHRLLIIYSPLPPTLSSIKVFTAAPYRQFFHISRLSPNHPCIITPRIHYRIPFECRRSNRAPAGGWKHDHKPHFHSLGKRGFSSVVRLRWRMESSGRDRGREGR